MSLKDAFGSLLSMHYREMTISRTGTLLTGTIKATPSNYSRNLEVANGIVTEGKEFVVTKAALDLISFPLPRRGDRLVDVDMGTMTITEVREMFDLGGAIIGYRIRTG